ncbi:conserved hypothetical protein [Methylorubrum populi BJ001]|jgi:hypothetical protein|uniref:Uncharacterized protein n=2 Tax=Methylorubrum TaxID=2282523 RepID=B1ZEF5_METPB|nr:MULTISPECIES: hypothetical protein [Methylorubrum]ACB79643.1 conserved hypothetical protein [Methylorubrum populi BJ001]MBA8914839.1 hypothetical protein [Methylorubrum thiocyanatum]OAH38694.1 hypothetical protein AX289_10650 [Methylorubrum populi]PZP70472.1 MAG: hypothetical protein DI590_10305 [Methylorubrum populi]GJE79252.1 hypothetical protein CJNNKLLH_0578 [Methylorubrum thiocyanatum]
MIALALVILAAAIANVTLVVFLAERFGPESGVHASAGELTSVQTLGRAPAATVTLANENSVAAATKIAA